MMMFSLMFLFCLNVHFAVQSRMKEYFFRMSVDVGCNVAGCYSHQWLWCESYSTESTVSLQRFAVCCYVTDFPRERVPVVLAPLLYPETLDLPASKLGIDSSTIPFSVCVVGYWCWIMDYSATASKLNVLHLH